jgi:hypothetical protein
MVDIAVKIYDNLQSDLLPVSVTAGISLHKLLAVEEVKSRLSDSDGIKNILTSYLKVMEEIDQEELIVGLEKVIEVFDDKVGPYAYDLCH